MDPNYAGSTVQIRLSFGIPPLGPDDAASAVVSIFDPTRTAVITDAALSYDTDTGEWTYQWLSPSDGGDRTYDIEGLFTGLDGSLTPAWGSIGLSRAPNAAPGEQVGVVPASRHWLSPWCDETDIPQGRLRDSNGEQIQDIQLGWMIAAATDLLYVLSGRKYRSGRSVVRPTSIVSAYGNQSFLYPYSSMSGYGSAWGFAAGWAWSAIGMGWWQSGQDLSEVLLQGNVTRINSVQVDGALLNDGDWVLYDRRRLVRLAGGAWPWNQSLHLDLTQPGTWQIDYEWGLTPPPSGRLAAAELAIELALGFSGQDSCKLPARVLSVATQGTNVAVGDALEFLKEDLTGLPLCDVFLRAYNPSKKRRRAAFLAPNSVLGRSS